MEVMDASLDNFYQKIYKNGQTIPEDVLGKIAFSVSIIMSREVRKLDFFLFENKGVDQLCSHCTADQRLCFRYTDSTYTQHLKILAFFCGSMGWFVLDLGGNPVDQFSHAAAHIVSKYHF